MSHDPLIAAARRRARLLQRADGRPYQTHLDEVARSTGADDWAAFTANPKAMPGNDDGKPVVATLHDKLTAASLFTILTGMVMIGAATFWPIEDGTAITNTIAGGLAVSILGTAYPTWYVTRHGFWPWLRHGRIERREEVENQRQLIRLGSIGPLVAVAMIWFILYMANRIGPDTVADVSTDRTTHVGIRMPGAADPYRIVEVRREGNVARMRAVGADGRLGWITTRHHMKLDDRLGGEALTRSYIHHPVIRIVGDVRCDTGAWRMIGIETSDTYDGPVAFSYRLSQGSGWKRNPLPESTRQRICSFRREERI